MFAITRYPYAKDAPIDVEYVQRVRDGYSVLASRQGRVSAFGSPLLAIMGSANIVFGRQFSCSLE